MTDRSESPNEPSGHFGTLTLTLLVTASMIGAGVYTTSGFALADLQSPRLVMLAWCVGGLIAICGAISYGQLARRLTQNGGEYLYLSRFVHPAAGCVAGWVSLLAGFTGAGAFAATTFEVYALPDDVRTGWLPVGGLAVGCTFILMCVHLMGTHSQSRLQNGVVILKLVGLVIFLGFAMFLWPDSGSGTSQIPAVQNDFDLRTFATSVMWISLSYCGFNAAIYVAGDATQKSRGVMTALVIGTLLVTLLYLLLNAVFVFGAPTETLAGVKDIAALRAKQLGGDSLEWSMRALICLGLISSVSSVLMTGPRVYAQMAKDRILPAWFATDNPTPRKLILFQGIAVIIVIMATSLKELLSYLGLTLSLCAAATVSTLLFMRPVEQTSPLSRLPALFYVLATLVLSLLMGLNNPKEAIACLITIAIGLGYYGLVRLTTNRPKQ